MLVVRLVQEGGPVMWIILFCSFGIFYAYRKLMNPKSGYAVSAG